MNLIVGIVVILLQISFEFPFFKKKPHNPDLRLPDKEEIDFSTTMTGSYKEDLTKEFYKGDLSKFKIISDQPYVKKKEPHERRSTVRKPRYEEGIDTCPPLPEKIIIRIREDPRYYDIYLDEIFQRYKQGLDMLDSSFVAILKNTFHYLPLCELSEFPSARLHKHQIISLRKILQAISDLLVELHPKLDSLVEKLSADETFIIFKNNKFIWETITYLSSLIPIDSHLWNNFMTTFEKMASINHEFKMFLQLKNALSHFSLFKPKVMAVEEESTESERPKMKPFMFRLLRRNVQQPPTAPTASIDDKPKNTDIEKEQTLDTLHSLMIRLNKDISILEHFKFIKPSNLFCITTMSVIEEPALSPIRDQLKQSISKILLDPTEYPIKCPWLCLEDINQKHLRLKDIVSDKSYKSIERYLGNQLCPPDLVDSLLPALA